jgi:hypothetical protein
MVVDGASMPAPLDVGALAPADRSAVIVWPDGLRLEVPAGYPTVALRALIAALRPAR